MSVASMTMDDQRPLINSYDKNSSSASTKYEQNRHITGGVVGGGGGGVVVGGGVAPPSGPASPSPSGSEELPTTSAAAAAASSSSHHHHSHPHHHNHHHHHHHHHHQAQQEQHQHQLHEQQQQPSLHAAIAEAVAASEQRQRLLEDEIENLKLEHSRLGLQYLESQRREKVLMRRLANKEQEFQEYVTQIAEYKAQQAPTTIALRTALLDPAVNILFERLRKELRTVKIKLEETQNELAAWKFTPDSNTGKRLMAKCRLLYQENEELGKMTSNGRLAKIETELAMQKSFSDEVKKSQTELDDFLQELDEDVEGMQSTILFLQQELKQTRDRVSDLEKENFQLQNGMSAEQMEMEGGTVGSNESPVLLINEDMSQQQQHLSNISMSNNINASIEQSSPNNNDFLKYAHAPPHHQVQVLNKLETINENECLQMVVTTSSSVVPHSLVDYYNNSNEQQQPLSLVQEPAVASHMQHMHDDGSNGVPCKRKRYDDEISISYMTATNLVVAAPPPTEPTTMESPPQQHVAVPQMPTREISTPRTLPPKKSKLRGITARRNSQLEECGLAGGNSPLLGIGIQSSIINAAPSTSSPSASVSTSLSHMGMIVDNAVVGMASEEYGSAPTSNAALATPTPMDVSPQQIDQSILDSSVAAARILTRRRSVRQMQQNGAGGSEY